MVRIKKTCPECCFTGFVDKYFGWRDSAHTVPQSRCLDCRAAHAKRMKEQKARIKKFMKPKQKEALTRETTPFYEATLTDDLKIKMVETNVSTRRAELKARYQAAFPRDKANRSVNFMTAKLEKKKNG